MLTRIHLEKCPDPFPISYAKAHTLVAPQLRLWWGGTLNPRLQSWPPLKVRSRAPGPRASPPHPHLNLNPLPDQTQRSVGTGLPPVRTTHHAGGHAIPHTGDPGETCKGFFFSLPFFFYVSLFLFSFAFCYPHGPDIARATMTFSDFLTHVLCM